MLVKSSLVQDREVKEYYTELFKRESIQASLKEWGEELDTQTILGNTRTIQNSPDGFSIFIQHEYLLVGAALGMVVPCLYSKTRYAMEIAISTLPNAPARTVLRLHKAFLKWAAEKDCEYTEIAEGPYTPATYGNFLTRLGYTRMGGVYVRRV